MVGAIVLNGWHICSAFCTACVFLHRYTGAACDQCVAGFYPHASQCVPQYINGRNIFDKVVDVEQQQKKFAGTIFLVIGGIAAACALASLAWVLYRWLVLGQAPKVALALQRLLRGRKAAGVPGVSQKYLLDDELELSNGPMRGAKPAVEDASVWSKVGASAHGCLVQLGVCGTMGPCAEALAM